MQTYKRKTNRCSYTNEDLKNAAKAVNDEGESPEKNALEEQQNKTPKKVTKPKKNMDKNRKKGVCRKILQSSEESDDDDYSCLICCEGYAENLPGENWIKCQACRKWAHTKCVPGAGLTFVCVNCNSDNYH